MTDRARWDALRRPTPEWFARARFGIFVHWGAYSVPAWAEPIGELGTVDDDLEWFTHNPYAEWYLNTIRIEQGQRPFAQGDLPTNVLARLRLHRSARAMANPAEISSMMIPNSAATPASAMNPIRVATDTGWPSAQISASRAGARVSTTATRWSPIITGRPMRRSARARDTTSVRVGIRLMGRSANLKQIET